MIDPVKIEKEIRSVKAHIQKITRAFNKRAVPADEKEAQKQLIQHLVDIDQYIRNFAVDKHHLQGKDIDQVTHKYKLQSDFNGDAQDRAFFEQFFPLWEEIDRQCTAQIKELLQTREWFTISEFDARTDKNAWLLVQHADLDPAFQKKVLAILEKLYPIGETGPSNYAYLYDRVAISYYDESKRKPQRYGTQGDDFAIEDPARMNERRQQLGMKPLLTQC